MKVKVIVERGEIGERCQLDKAAFGNMHHKEVPVTINFMKNKTIGNALLLSEDDCLKAEMNIEKKFLDLVPCVGGVIRSSRGKYGINIITDFLIKEVSLCKNNEDASIKSIREQINE